MNGLWFRATRLLFAATVIFNSTVLSASESSPVEIHYAPTENLEHYDIRLIDSAQHRIDAAIYVLSDWAIVDALKRAVGRGVEIRIVIDRMQKHAYGRFDELEPWVRYKVGNAPMHLKAYVVDGKLLRTGSANFSASGLKQQDNDLVIVRSDLAASDFEREFSRLWSTGTPLKPSGSAVR